MRELSAQEAIAVGGGEPTVSGVVAAIGFGLAIATAPAMGSAIALIGLTALFVRALE